MKSLVKIVLLATILLSVGCSSITGANSSNKMFTVGILHYAAAFAPAVEGFKKRMNELGYVEGQNIKYVYDGPVLQTGDPLMAEANKLMAPGIDLVFAMSTPAILAAKTASAASGKPIVFTGMYDPVKAGVVASLKEPGGNVTGIWHGISDPKRLEWFTKLVPGIKRLYVPYNPNDASAKFSLERTQAAADELGIQLITKAAPDAASQDAAVLDIPDGVDGVFMVWDNAIGTRVQTLVRTATARNLPVAGLNPNYAQNGSLFTYGFDLVAAGRQGARLVDQVLKGVKPADIPIETAEFFLAFNLGTAKQLGISIPDDYLLQASKDNLYYNALPALTPTPRPTF